MHLARHCKNTSCTSAALLLVFWGVFVAEHVALSATDEGAATRQPRARAPADRVQPQEPAANPLNRFLKQLFGAGSKPGLEGDADGTGQNAPGAGRLRTWDAVDQAAPYDPTVESQFRRFKARLQEGNWNEAFKLSFHLLARPEDSLIRGPDGQWRSLRAESIRLMTDLPREALDLFQRTHEASAARRLKEAETERDFRQIAEVAVQYFQTDSGKHAADRMASYHLDRGEFVPASLWLERLMPARPPFTRTQQWRMKALLAFRQAGRTELADEIEEELPSHSERQSTGPNGPSELSPVDRDGAMGLPKRGQDKLQEWPVLLGTPSRSGRTSESHPLLLPGWFHSATDMQPLAEQIERLTEDLTGEGYALIPAFVPVTAGGKAVCRDLRGIQVVDIETGRLLWQVRERFSPERFLAQQPFRAGSRSTFPRFVAGRVSFTPGGANAGQHPLANLLFRNGTYGVVSSDGIRVFTVEDNVVLSRYQPGQRIAVPANPAGRSGKTSTGNRLVARDLKTGRSIWELGGPGEDGSFGLPLRGVYFLGAPLPVGNDLYVVGEKDNEIRLYELEPATGDMRWSQLLALTDVEVARDLQRRWWAIQVAASNGVLVCPTSVGWLMAIEPVSRTILWGHRLKPRNLRLFDVGLGALPVASSTRLTAPWGPSAPIVSGHRVVQMAPDGDAIVCLDLATGRLIWQKQKSDVLYVAGVFEDRVILISNGNVTALNIEDGGMLWNRPTDSAAGLPSGRGLLASDQLLLPLGSRELWAIRLDDGAVEAKMHSGGKPLALGNLATDHGTLVSLHPLGVTCYGQRQDEEERTAAKLASSPDDREGLMRRAEIAMLDDDFSAAWNALRHVVPEKLTTAQEPRYRQLMFDCLVPILRADSEPHNDELAALKALVQTEDEQFLWKRLNAERLVSQKKLDQALDMYWDLTKQMPNQMLQRWDAPNVSVRTDRWIGGKLTDLWDRLPTTVQEQADTRMGQAVESLKDASAAKQERFLQWAGFHPSTIPLKRRLADDYANRGEHVLAETLLRRMAAAADPKVATESLDRLERLQRRLDEKTAGSSRTDSLDADWSDAEFRIERIGARFATPDWELSRRAIDPPFFWSHRVRYSRRTQRLEIADAVDESLWWTIPLQSRGRTVVARNLDAFVTDHRLLILHGDVLHCLAPVERRVLWTKTLGPTAPGNGSFEAFPEASSNAFVNWSQLRVGSLLVHVGSHDGAVALASRSYVCVRDRRQLAVLDPSTGQVVWTLDGVRQDDRIVGSEEAVFVVPRSSSGVAVFRSHDGRPLSVSNVDRLMSRSLQCTGCDLTVYHTFAEAAGVEKTPVAAVERFDPFQNAVQWRQEFSRQSVVKRLDEQRLAVLSSDGRLELTDLATGARQAMESIPVKMLQDSQQQELVGDSQRLYLLLNRRQQKAMVGSLPSVPSNGVVIAFDRVTGKRLWTQEMNEQNLILRHLDIAPCLVFVVQEPKRDGQIDYRVLRIVLLDKQSGKRIVDVAIPTSTAHFADLDVNLAEKSIELRTFNERVRFVASTPAVVNAKTEQSSP